MLTFGKLRLWLVVLGALLLGAGIFALVGHAQADTPGTDTRVCIVCHATPGLTMQLASGETLAVQIDPAEFAQSVHGNQLQCTACHPDITGYPHPARDIVHPSARDIPFLVRSYANCGTCHPEQYTEYLGSVHARALADGKSDSAVCSDCHGAHDITPAKPSDVGLALVPAVYSCANCHPQEFEDYRNSVHGKALLEKGDLNVPSCIDCHTPHGMLKAKDNPDFRTQSVAICVSCHADQKLMTQYGLSTRILSTYVADFHGATAQLYPSRMGQAPEQAMCYDCHGNHAIQSTVSANGLVQANLLTICQKCHKEATANFPAAWVGHHDPTPDNVPLVFWIRSIYNVLITGTVLLLVSHITLDIRRVFLNTLRGGSKSHE
jgi:predicted CXXCH cytochrome family protein